MKRGHNPVSVGGYVVKELYLFANFVRAATRSGDIHANSLPVREKYNPKLEYIIPISIRFCVVKSGAGDEIRTHDPNLGKVRVSVFERYQESSREPFVH